jgi:hypothetical protein
VTWHRMGMLGCHVLLIVVVFAFPALGIDKVFIYVAIAIILVGHIFLMILHRKHSERNKR